MTIMTPENYQSSGDNIEVRCPVCGEKLAVPFVACKRYSDICLSCSSRYSIHIFQDGMIVVE